MLLSLFNCKAQETKSNAEFMKIDSVFNYYFFLFELETSSATINEANKKLYIEIILESDTVYILKDLPQAVNLVSEMSQIKVPRSERSAEMLLTKDIVNLWIKWYKEDRNKIIWSNNKNKPILDK